MAKPVTFKRSASPSKSRSTDFNFGANVPTFTANKRRGARGASKKGGARQTRSATGGGS